MKPKRPKKHTPNRLRSAINAFFAFAVREKRAILYLLPLLGVVSLLLATVNRPRFEKSFPYLVDKVYDSLREAREVRTEWSPKPRGGGDSPRETHAGELFAFDPNTIDLAGLQRLGFSERQAQGILNYRDAGKIFRKPSDFAACYTVSDAMYARIAPYIIIGAGFSAVPDGEKPRAESPATTEPDPLPDPEVSARPKIDLNTADSALLVTVSGIGPLTAGRIVAYRARLGGFDRKEQLAEIQGMTEQNFERIVQEISVDRAGIQKIDINFADPKRLADHPYLGAAVRRKILKQRQLKGGWSTIGEMVEDNTLSPGEAEKLTPYLRFTPAE